MKVAEEIAKVKKDALDRILKAEEGASKSVKEMEKQAAGREAVAAQEAAAAAEIQTQAARREAEAEEGITEAIRKAAEVKKAEGKLEEAEKEFARERLEASRIQLDWAVNREKDIEDKANAAIKVVEDKNEVLYGKD